MVLNGLVTNGRPVDISLSGPVDSRWLTGAGAGG